MPVEFVCNGAPVTVPDTAGSLLEALRDSLGVRSPKDGCSPQGQCGCCTVLVDGQPRVACVTPVARVAGRAVTTIEGLEAAPVWAEALCATGGSQCGFCTPGIVMRLDALRVKAPLSPAAVDQALLAHLCRCTGWQTIREAAAMVAEGRAPATTRDLAAAERRAAIEGGTPQSVGGHVALGAGGFADDRAPRDALVAVRNANGEWVVAASLTAARAAAGKVQGRRTTAGLVWPIEVPTGSWTRTLKTTWVEPAYLEPDASWCEPGGEPVSPLANGGAFGGKLDSEVRDVARTLANRHGRVVRVLASREDIVRFGPKRPPMAAGIAADGRGVMHVARTAGIVEAVHAVAPALDVIEVDVTGPPTSAAVRGAGWVEAAVVLASLGDDDDVTSPTGATASAVVTPDAVRVRVRCGAPLDETVLRSYCVGAAHMALGWVTSEGIAVGADGDPQDLTIRSFGVLRAVDMPPVTVTIDADDGEPVNGSDAVFAAVAAAAWRRLGHPPEWPARRRH